MRYGPPGDGPLISFLDASLASKTRDQNKMLFELEIVPEPPSAGSGVYTATTGFF
jgi:hypothetical protein